MSHFSSDHCLELTFNLVITFECEAGWRMGVPFITKDVHMSSSGQVQAFGVVYYVILWVYLSSYCTALSIQGAGFWSPTLWFTVYHPFHASQLRYHTEESVTPTMTKLCSRQVLWMNWENLCLSLNLDCTAASNRDVRSTWSPPLTALGELLSNT